MGSKPTLVLPYHLPVTVPEPIRLDPARYALAASLTTMEAVTRCHGAMAPERFHAWLEAELRAATGADEPAGLVLEGRARRRAPTAVRTIR